VSLTGDSQRQRDRQRQSETDRQTDSQRQRDRQTHKNEELIMLRFCVPFFFVFCGKDTGRKNLDDIKS